ncbi:MAG: RimK family alpha-L-glutamate ligase [Pseudomonadota bacterium]
MRSKPLALAILTIEPEGYSARRLAEAATARGHDVQLLDTMGCSLHVESSTFTVRHQGAELPRVDCVIPRIGAAMTGHGCALVRQLKVMGVPSLGPADAIETSRDKRRAHQMLARAGLAMPSTLFVCVPRSADDLIAAAGPLPLIVKPVRSSQGEGVTLARTTDELQATIDGFAAQQTDFLVQEFIEEADGEDIRCFVIGDDVVAAMRRKAAPGEFRSNLHQGGSAEAAEISDEERGLAIRAAQTFGLSVAGVDLLRSEAGPLVLEVNSSPGLEGVEGCTGKDLAGLMITEAERVAAAHFAALGHPGAAA